MTYKQLTRRHWMRVTGQAAFATAIARPAAATRQTIAPARQPVLCFFSKHLPDLNWKDLGRAVKDAGFDGVDLTVRPGGHVLPERAADDLPRALDAIRRHGLIVPMTTTEILSASDPKT